MKPLRPILLLLGVITIIAPAAAEEKINFNRDIRPIISEYCFQCHGPDPGSRKQGLRFDTEEGFFSKGAKHGVTVIKGRPEESPLYLRMIETDPDEIMPPPESHKTMKPEEIAKIKKWIEQGAEWMPHWSFIPPQKAPLPSVKNSSWAKHPIDHFVLAELEKNHLTPAVEADRRTLARRWALDLTGLTPKIEDVERYVHDSAPGADERYVDALMSSPAYGEHRARYWLDAARYADTHGLHFDNYREIWPYRDWVIQAFNKNQSFDQFTIEQIGGDLLPNPTRDQLIATGFHRNNITTNEGGTIEEENLAIYARDRVETTSWVFLGLTANCAVCHDHKFDPITQKDFYAMEAYFRNTTQPALDGNVKDSTPSIVVPSMNDLSAWEALPGKMSIVKNKMQQHREQTKAELEKWKQESSADKYHAKLPQNGLIVHMPLTEGQDRTINAYPNNTLSLAKEAELHWEKDGRLGPALRFRKGMNVSFDEKTADFEKDQKFSYGAWIYGEDYTYKNGPLLAKMDSDNNLRGWDLWIEDRRITFHLVHSFIDNCIRVTTYDQVLKSKKWQHLFVTYDGSGRPDGIKIFLDGKRISHFTAYNNLTKSIRNNVPFTLAERYKSKFNFDSIYLQDLRVYDRELDEAEISSLIINTTPAYLLQRDRSDLTDNQKSLLADYYYSEIDPQHISLNHELAKLEQEYKMIKDRSPVTHIQMENNDTMPTAYVLMRGNYNQKGEKVEPAPFHFLHPKAPNTPKNRLGLAQWLMQKENPLTSRVTVNRFWQELFGTGLVRTSEDFGIMGDHPVHQALLDWLAVDFQENGWDVKRLIRSIVLSATYRQSAIATPEKIEKDQKNAYFSRGPRFRMDGEMIRDQALASSGLLVTTIGGRSVRPYQPEGVWEAVAMPPSNTREYKQDKGDDLYRRSLYTFWKRSAPPANLDIFNAPSRETSCLRRERTNTPLQALVTMNDTQIIEASRHLAQRALLTTEGKINETLDFIARRVLARPLKSEEVPIYTQLYENSIKHYREQKSEAEALISVGESKANPSLDASSLAAWTMVVNLFFNLDEVLNK